MLLHEPLRNRRAKEALSRKRLRKNQRRKRIKNWAVRNAGSPFRFSSRLRRGNFRESGPRKQGSFGSCFSFRPAGPREPRPAVPGYWSPQASRLSGTKSAQAPARNGPWERRLMIISDRVADVFGSAVPSFVCTAGEAMFCCRQGLQKRTEALQELHSKAGRGRGGGVGDTPPPMRSETKPNCSQCRERNDGSLRPTRGGRFFCPMASSNARAMDRLEPKVLQSMGAVDRRPCPI